MNRSGLNLKNARQKKQIEVMKKIIEDGVCPFCHDFVDRVTPFYHSKPILLENDCWVATENAWPYKNTDYHFLFVIKRHILTIEEMTDEERRLFWDILSKVKNKFDITHSTLLMRSDSTNQTGATVQHLHAQLIVAKKGEKVITRIG